MRKIKGRKTIIQDHAQLAHRLNRMAWAIRRKGKEMTDDEKRQASDLEEQAMAHSRKAKLFGSAFTMIL